MRVLKVITLLSFLFLQNCDFGCVGAEEFGILTLKNIEVNANPFGTTGLNSSVAAICKTGCETSYNGECGTSNFWMPLNEEYNSNYDYHVTVTGMVSFCSVTNMVGTNPPNFLLSSAVSSTSLDQYGNIMEYPSNVPISNWNDVSDNGVVLDAMQDGNLPSIDCSSKQVAIDNSTGHVANMQVGSYNDLNALTPGIAFNEDVVRADVPVGCGLDLYDKPNLNPTGFVISIPHGDYDILTTSFTPGGCTGNSVFYVGSTGYEVAALSSSTCLTALHTLNYGTVNINDQVNLIDVAAGCKMEIDQHCWNPGSQYGTINGGGEMSGGWWDMSAYRILQETDYSWQKNVSSASVNNVPISSSFSNTTNMAPTIRDGIFGTFKGLEFDGINDFLYFDSVVPLIKAPHTMFFIVNGITGTLFSSSKDDFSVNERLFVDPATSQLKYQIGSNAPYTLNTSPLPHTALVTIIRSNTSLIVNINGEEVYNSVVPLIDSSVNVTRATIGQYWDNSSFPTDFVPSDFLTGHIGTIRGYPGALSGTVLHDIEKELMVYWGVLNCGFGKHLDRVRLRIGDVEVIEPVFNPISSVFEVPAQYHSESGNMMIRLADPIVEGNGCATTVGDINLNRDLYEDNLGSLAFNFRITKDSSMVGSLYEFFIQPIERYITGEGMAAPGIQQVFFEGVTGAGGLVQELLYLALVFFVMFTGISYMMGFVRYSNYDLLSRIIKAGVVLTLISDGSWVFFSDYVITFFRDGALDLFSQISLLVNSDTGVISGASSNSVMNLFSNLDNIFAMFISSQVNAKIWGLLFFPPFIGFLMILMFYYAFYVYIHIIAKVLILYVSIFIMMTFAFIVAPVFIIFVLFEKTKDYFTKWLDLLIGYSVQLVFLSVVVGIFTWMIMAVFIDLLNYTVCWKPVLYCCGDGSSIHFTLLEFFRPASFDYRRFGADVKMHYAPEFWDVVLFLFMIYLFREFLSFAMDLATAIAGGVSTGSLADSIGKTLGTDNMYKTATNAASSGVKYGMRAGGAVGMAGGTVVAGVAGLAAGGLGAMAKVTGSQRMANYSKSAAKFSARTVEQSYSKGMKAMNDTYYRQAKGEFYNQTMGRINRAAFGIRGPEEQQLINKIQSSVKQGMINAAIYEEDKNGNPINKSKDVEIKKQVRKMLEKKGLSQKKIEKILNSKQLAKDIKYSKLKTSDAKNILSDSYVSSYQKARNNAENDSSLLKKGQTVHQYAQEEAKKSMKKSKEAIGKLLRAELAVQKDPMGRYSKQYGDASAVIDRDDKKIEDTKNPALRAMRKAGRLKDKADRGRIYLAGKASKSLDNAGNYVTMNKVEARLNNMAAMSRRLEKDLEKFGEDNKVRDVKSAVKYAASGVKDPVVDTARGVGKFAEKYSIATKKTKNRTAMEEREYQLYDDQREAKKDDQHDVPDRVDISAVDQDKSDDIPDFSDDMDEGERVSIKPPTESVFERARRRRKEREEKMDEVDESKD